MAMVPLSLSGISFKRKLSLSYLISSFSKNKSIISEVSYPKALNNIVAGNFLFLSILANKESLGSNSKSSHEPR